MKIYERSLTQLCGVQQVHGQSNNNYHRPGGQNVGNYLTDRNSSRVLAPPGGASTLSLG